MLHLEIQEGRVRMAEKKHHKKLGATAACVMRAVDASRKFTCFNDSTYFRPSIHGDDQEREEAKKKERAQFRGELKNGVGAAESDDDSTTLSPPSTTHTTTRVKPNKVTPEKVSGSKVPEVIHIGVEKVSTLCIFIILYYIIY